MPKRSSFQVRNNSVRQRWQIRDDEKEAFWRRHFVSWEQSGLSKSAYCKEHQLTYSCFLYWRRKVKKRNKGHARATNAAGLPAEIAEKVANPFVPIRLLSEGVKKAEPREASGPNITSKRLIEIVLPGGAVIRLNDAWNAGFIAELVSALRA